MDNILLLGLGVALVGGGCWLARWQWRKRQILNAVDALRKKVR